MGIFIKHRDAVDWRNAQVAANQQTHLQQMVYEQSLLIGELLEAQRRQAVMLERMAASLETLTKPHLNKAHVVIR